MLICTCGYNDFKNIQCLSDNIIILTCCHCENIIRINILEVKEKIEKEDAEFKYEGMF